MEDDKLTPMMKQYLELKNQYQNEVLFFRLGDFYEMFYEDAVEVSRLLNITLTSRNGIPMCGVPHHAAKNYIKRLLDAGKKVAICEQTEMPNSVRSIAKREVVQVISTGTAVEEEFIDSSDNNFILAIDLQKELIGAAYCELSSGKIFAVELNRENRFEQLRSLFEELRAKEVLINEEHYFSDSSFKEVIDQMQSMKTRLDAWFFSTDLAYNLLTEHFNSISLKQFGLQKQSSLLAAVGSLFRYLKESSKTSLEHLETIKIVDRTTLLLIDESSRKNLELLRNLQDYSEQRSLYSSLNKCCTSGGSRLLKEWISQPLAKLEPILERQEWVTWFLEHDQERQRVRSLLSSLRDLSRLATRVSMHRSNPSDLVSIREAIATFFELTEQYQQRYKLLLENHLSDQQMGSLVALMEQLFKAIDENCLGPYKPNQVIKQNYNEELDSLRALAGGGKDKLEEYVDNLKKETQIPIIKLSQNKIIGHFLEIPKTHSDKVPPTFFRKQTLVNAERYTTDKLTDFENEILHSLEKAEKLERELYNQIVAMTNELTSSLLNLGHFFSKLDTLQSFAHVAHLNNYFKPNLVEEDVLMIEEGRHPVVEQHMQRGTFIPNPLKMDLEDKRFCLITGPNMAGKSTYLRQNALIVLMAQIGSYVPASKATIGIVDRLYCRVGASDNIARGESTFLIEMQEAAYILNSATSRSLAIVDEIGRGTSTQDGMSIAYAVMKMMVDLKIKTLFATHYHELTMLDTTEMQLLTLEVVETKRSIQFLRKIKNGVANSSYGLHVAKMAGMPSSVLRDAANFQKQHFADYSLGENNNQLDLFTGYESSDQNLASAYNLLIDKIESFDLNSSTPLDAMQFVNELLKFIE
jgi:DNA mismatch repair protein MutS